MAVRRHMLWSLGFGLILYGGNPRLAIADGHHRRPPRFPLRLKSGETMHGRRVNFPGEVTTSGDARKVFVEMVREARCSCNQMDVLFRQDRRVGDVSVENVGIKVASVRPCYGTEIRIDANLRKGRGVT